MEHIWRHLAFASFGIAMGGSVLSADAQTVCTDGGPAPAVLISFEGDVQIQRAAGGTAAPALDLALCPGDRITTGDASGVDLRFEAKNSVTNILSSSTVVIPPRAEADITLSGGLMRFISSVRGAFVVRTPNTDAGIDGTEAMLAVNGPTTDTLVLVREGVVTVTDRRGAESLSLAAGQASYASANTTLIRATPDNVPEKFRGFLLNPEGAADWAVYYPPILLGADSQDPTIQRGAGLLDAGEPDRAEELLGAYQGEELGNALALRSIAAVFRNRIDDGTRLADEATAAAPNQSAGFIAQSYAAQASGNLASARDAALEATKVAPEDAYAWARLAELQLTIGHRRGALAAARQSLSLAETSLARSVLGFAHLSAKDRDLAENSFARAIEIDSEDPLPRLGLGLSFISRGNVETGRQEIETATSFDPQRAQLRTWLGRAYAEERLGEKAQAQFGLAIEQDPDDPTPWQFLAEQYFAANRPVEALGAINEANARGERRATVRGARGLGEDRSVRSAAEGRIYDVLGFDLLATRAGSDAVTRDPTNPGSHLFLADVYRSRPGFQVAQASELLVAQLYSKPSKNALQPSLTEADLALLDTSGAARVSFHEFSPLFDDDGFHAVASAGLGTTAFFEDEISLSLLQGNYSLNVSQFHSQSTGFRPNEDVRHEIVSVVGKAQVTPGLTLTAEGRFRQTDEGDRFLRSFEDPTTIRSQELSNRFQFSLGGHAELSPSNDMLFRAAIAQENSDLVSRFFFPSLGIELLLSDDDATIQSYNFELQDTHRFDQGHIIVGGFLGLSELEIDAPGLPPVFRFLEDTTQFTAYAYGFLNPVDWAEVTLGVSFDRTDFLEASSGFDPFFNDIRVTNNRDFSQFNPKLGLQLTPFDGLVLRGAYTRTLARENIQDQTLEPTTIAGFNQFFDDFAQTDSELFGAGFDLQILDNLWLVGEFTRRELDNPTFDFDLTTFNQTIPIFLDGDERSFRGELNATYGERWSGSIGVQYLDFETELLDRPDEVETLLVPVRVTYFDPTGIFASAEATYFTQSSIGQDDFDDGLLSIDVDEEGLVLNASVGYRFPNERGVASIELNNILDQSFSLQNSLVNSARPINRSLAEGFTAIGRVTLSF